jgi:phage shock protein C
MQPIDAGGPLSGRMLQQRGTVATFGKRWGRLPLSPMSRLTGIGLSRFLAFYPARSALRRMGLGFGDGAARLFASIDRLSGDAMAESDELGRLGDLHARGILSDDEFSRAKARVLKGPSSAPGQAPIVHAINGLYRSRDDRWLGGVCGGIGRSSGIASWIWRLLFTLLVLCAGTGVLLYVLLWIFVPREPAGVAPGQAGAFGGSAGAAS